MRAKVLLPTLNEAKRYLDLGGFTNQTTKIVKKQYVVEGVNGKKKTKVYVNI